MNQLLALFLIAAFFQPSFAASTQPDWQAYDQVIENILTESKVPGVAVGVIKGHQAVLQKGYGQRDLEQGLPVTANTLFAIGSTTKALTAATIGMLVDENKLKLEEPIRNYIADFRLQDDYATAHATLIDLMSHQTGVPRHDLVWYGYDEFPRSYFWQKLQHLEPSLSFREGWQYNNFMFMAAGYILEKISGQTWEEFVRERIFTPLEMTNSNFSVTDTEATDDFSGPYHFENGSPSRVPMRPIVGMGPAGSINSNVHDMLSWLDLNLSKGAWQDQQLLSPKTFAAIHEPRAVVQGRLLPFSELSQMTYSLGWMNLIYRGHKLVFHTGGIDGFSAWVGFLPDDGVGVVVLQNTDTKGAVMFSGALTAIDTALGLEPIDWFERFKSMETQSLEPVAQSFEQVVEEPLQRSAEDYVGVYSNVAYDDAEIFLNEDRLSLKWHNMTFSMKHLGNGVFRINTPNSPEINNGLEPMVFEVDNGGRITELLILLEPTVAPIRFKRN